MLCHKWIQFATKRHGRQRIPYVEACEIYFYSKNMLLYDFNTTVELLQLGTEQKKTFQFIELNTTHGLQARCGGNASQSEYKNKTNVLYGKSAMSAVCTVCTICITCSLHCLQSVYSLPFGVTGLEVTMTLHGHITFVA